MTVLLVVLGTLCLAGTSVVLWLLATANQRWESAAERGGTDREVRVAEHRLHNLAGHAFRSMLDEARGGSADLNGTHE